MLEKKINNSHISDNLTVLMSVEKLIKSNDFEKAVLLLQDVPENKLTKKEKALKLFLTAKIATFEGDFLTASETAAAALKLFQKYNLLFEEAQTYFLLGNLYRVSGIFDSADFMLRSAVKLFSFLKAEKYLAETFGTLGLLMGVQKRFDEANQYFEKASAYAAKDKSIGDFILCQQALLALSDDKPLLAKKILQPFSKGMCDTKATGLALETLARISLSEKKYSSVIKNAKTAVEEYKKQKNFAGYFECCYLMATAYAKQNKLNQAEDVLRKIIEEEKLHKSCFFVANAYTLLGLVMLKKGEISRAKTIFNQALKHELRCDRKYGIAIDYANLALLEKKYGSNDEALKNMEAALCYAKGADEDLYEAIKNLSD